MDASTEGSLMDALTRKRPATTASLSNQTPLNHTTLQSTCKRFQNQMQSSGFNPPEIIADGKPHRFDIDKRGDHKGYYQLFTDGVPFGLYGSWAEQEPGTWLKWSAKSEKSMTDAELKENKRRWKQAQIERQKELAESHRLAAIEAQKVWDTSTPASDDNAYLKTKGVRAHGIRQRGDDLIIPVRIKGKLSSIQTIQPDCTKLFQKDGAIAGGYYSIAGDDATNMTRIYIVEGYATGATIREATGDAVAVAFNAGNLKPVAKAIRAKFPDIEIIIAGDTDKSGTGQKKARAAADVVGGKVVLPVFADDESGSDWNDYSAIHGLDAVKVEIEKQLSALAEKSEKTAFLCPFGYSCDGSGVSIQADNDKDPERLTHKPVWVSALSRDGLRENWGKLVHWQDADGGEHERAIPAKLFHANGNELAQELSASGLPIIPGKERKLLQYLAAFNPDARLTAAPATGWHGQAFVLPDRTINEPANERIIYQASEYQNAGCIGSRGSLADWKTLMRDVSPIVKFAIACSLAAPLRYLSNTAAGGFHFYGRTSQGKTTMLQAASSVWGNGCDPAMAGGADAYIQRWNATKNGLEGMASSFNDLPLIIDEIGEGEESNFGRIIYQLMSGTGKQRANRTGGMRQRRAWRILLLSNGELPVSDFIPNARGGQLVRLIDIQAKDMFRDRADADRMKHGCAENYGLAGPAFIESGNLLDGWDTFTAESIGEAHTPEAGRVRDRFKLVAHAGELAIQRGILPWQKGDVLDACKSVYASWKETGCAVSDAERGITNVRNFIMAFSGSRFEYDESNRVPLDRAGVFRDNLYHFFSPAFKEACGGVLADTVKRALADAGLLHTSEGKKFVSKVRIDGELTRVVSVKSAILSDIEKTTGDTGDRGYRPRETRAKPVPPDEMAQGTQGTAGEGVPPVPPCKTPQGTAESVAAQGLYPPSHLSHHENAKSENIGDDEAFDDPFPDTPLEDDRVRASL